MTKTQTVDEYWESEMVEAEAEARAEFAKRRCFTDIGAERILNARCLDVTEENIGRLFDALD